MRRHRQKPLARVAFPILKAFAEMATVGSLHCAHNLLAAALSSLFAGTRRASQYQNSYPTKLFKGKASRGVDVGALVIPVRTAPPE